MTTPQYQKIPGEKLTVDQFTQVQESLMIKFGFVWPKDTAGHFYYFRTDGSFAEVWQ